jgi:hypothetical protein
MLEIIWGGLRIIIKMCVIAAACGVFYFDIWNTLTYTFFAIDRNWWKENKNPFKLTWNNFWPQQGAPGEHFVTSNGYVIAAFSWIFWLLIWFYIFIGGTFIILEFFFVTLTCNKKKWTEWCFSGKLRTERFFLGLTNYQYNFKPENFKINPNIVVEPQEDAAGGDRFQKVGRRLQSTQYCPECGKLFDDSDVIVIPHCNKSHWVHEKCFSEKNEKICQICGE